MTVSAEAKSQNITIQLYEKTIKQLETTNERQDTRIRQLKTTYILTQRPSPPVQKIQVPDAPDPYEKSEYPDVPYWTRTRWKDHLHEQTSLGNSVPRLDFLTDGNGDTISSERIKEMTIKISRLIKGLVGKRTPHDDITSAESFCEPRTSQFSLDMLEMHASATSPSSPPQSTPSVSYRAQWIRENDSAWAAFHEEWWGSSGRTRIYEALSTDSVLRVQEGERQPLNMLRPTRGSLYVREEYKSFIARLQNARKAMDASELHGCLILGQPGIGKSCFLVYLLLEIMSKEEAVLFTTSHGWTYLFDESGVYGRHESSINRGTDLPTSSRTWSLVDCPINKEPLPARVTYVFSKLFFVAALSPEASHYKEVAKQMVGQIRIWWMSPWTDDELCSLTSQPPLSKHQSAWKTFSTVEDSVRSLRAEVGPCPRDILLKVIDPALYEHQIKGALREYPTLDKIITLVGQGASAGTSNAYYHIILVRRIGPVLEDSYGSDSSFATLKTVHVRQYVMDQFLSLELQEAKKLFSTCSGIGPRGAVFAGHLFEGLAVRYTSGENFGITDAFGPFTQMTRVETQGTKFPVRFHHQMVGSTLTIIVDEDGRAILRISPPKTESTHVDGKQRKPWSPRKPALYHEDSQPIVDPTKYYRPHSSNNPLFDAFFYDIESSKVTLWVIQMTIKRDHDGSRKGFKIIDKLKEAAQDAKRLPVEVKYVLVVPQTKSGCDAEWNLASEFDEYKGDVFLQQLNVSLLSGGDRWEAEDFFGLALPASSDKDVPSVTSGTTVTDTMVRAPVGVGTTARGGSRKKAKLL